MKPRSVSQKKNNKETRTGNKKEKDVWESDPKSVNCALNSKSRVTFIVERGDRGRGGRSWGTEYGNVKQRDKIKRISGGDQLKCRQRD